MSEEIPKLRLQQAWRECRQHVHYMVYALTALAPKLPLTGASLQSLDAETVQDLDQFVLRFGKLQDAIGSRLLPAVLTYLQEPYEHRPMLDKLNRLEQLGYLERAEDWPRLRAIRNQFAHEYPDEPERNASVLNMAIDAAAIRNPCGSDLHARRQQQRNSTQPNRANTMVLIESRAGRADLDRYRAMLSKVPDRPALFPFGLLPSTSLKTSPSSPSTCALRTLTRESNARSQSVSSTTTATASRACTPWRSCGIGGCGCGV